MLVSVALKSSAMVHNSSPKRAHAMHWFRKGLRLQDNPALLATLDQNPSKLYPVYVLDGDCYQLLRCTPLRVNFLLETLHDLDKNLRKRGSRLYVLNADKEAPASVLSRMWKEWEITHLSFEEDETGEPYACQRDTEVIEAAESMDIRLHAVASETIYPMKGYMKKAGSKGPPATMTAFQKLFKSMSGVDKVKAAPDDFPDNEDEESLADKFLPPQRLTDLPWPRDTPRDQVEYVWGPKDCKNLSPVVRGGETQALKVLEKSLSNAR